jgi:hypothetical protein
MFTFHTVQAEVEINAHWCFKLYVAALGIGAMCCEFAAFRLPSAAWKVPTVAYGGLRLPNLEIMYLVAHYTRESTL